MSEATFRTLCGKEYSCPIEITLDIIGGKWKPIIIWHLGQRGTQRFSEVRKRMPSITQKMLTQQLRELENDGVLLRKVYAQVPPKVEYTLTPTGRSLLPLLEQLGRWGQQYYTDCDSPDKNAPAFPL